MVDAKQANVLVVEDNMDNMYFVVELLRHRVGVHFVDAVVTGYELFNRLRALPDLDIDLILLDIQIPGEDGYSVLRRIRAEPRLATTKVVAVTANVMAYDIERTRQAGFDGFIGKPLQFKRFPDQIHRILQGESVWETR